MIDASDCKKTWSVNHPPRQDGKADINLHIVSVDRGVIRVGVDAPKDVVILRDEIRDRGAKP